MDTWGRAKEEEINKYTEPDSLHIDAIWEQILFEENREKYTLNNTSRSIYDDQMFFLM